MQVSFRTVGKIDASKGDTIGQCQITLDDREAMKLLHALARAGWGQSESLIMTALQLGDDELFKMLTDDITSRGEMLTFILNLMLQIVQGGRAHLKQCSTHNSH